MDVASLPLPSMGLSIELAFEAGALVRARFTDVAPRAAPADPRAQAAFAMVERHLETGREDLSTIAVALEGLSPFERATLEALRQVRAGATITYGELAARVGSPGAARAVGGAMARNPIPLVVPCHRVLPSTGELGNYSGRGGVATKLALLRLEGARF